jgi:hypothetical protein
VYLKTALSAAGLGVHRCATEAELVRQAGVCAGAFQVQEEIPPSAIFLNVQYRARDGRAEFVATTEQILDGTSHVGNRWPARCDPRVVTDNLADDLVRQGLRGVFAFDLAATGYPRDPQYRLLECNPRWNGASYLWFTARKLGTGAWMGLTLTCAGDFAAFDLEDLEYRSSRGFGLLVVNWTRCRHGKIFVLAVGRPEEQQVLLKEMARRGGWIVPAGADQDVDVLPSSDSVPGAVGK